MGHIVKKRILAFKSIMGFGKFGGLSVSMVAQMDPKYLIWVYYHLEVIGFLDDVLDYLMIPEKYRIEKPGKSPEMFERLGVEVRSKYVRNMTDEQRLKRWQKKNGLKVRYKKHFKKIRGIRAKTSGDLHRTSSLSKK